MSPSLPVPSPDPDAGPAPDAGSASGLEASALALGRNGAGAGLDPAAAAQGTSAAHSAQLHELLRAIPRRKPAAAMGHRERELVRLIMQSLHELGYSDSAMCLQQESGLVLESPLVSHFRNGVLAGDWSLVERLIPQMEMLPPTDGEREVKFLVRQQKFLELLERQEVKRALSVLRGEIAPLGMPSSRLHELSSLIMCSSVEEIKKRAKWDGVAGRSRDKLLDSLQEYFSPSMMIPAERLNALLDQAVQLQISKCMYHNTTSDQVSLYSDHVCSRHDFPILTTHILEEHTDEVWFLAFSPDGSMLASASKDARVIIWDVATLSARFILEDHSEAVSFLAWSPDSARLLTASNDHTLRLWNSSTGRCETTYARHTESVTSCAWHPNGDRFVSGSLDKHIFLWNIHGDLLYEWKGLRVMDLAISVDGNTLIASSDKKIRLYDLTKSSGGEMDEIQESDSITSVYVAADGRHLLVNLSIQEIHLWDMQQPRKLVRKYVGLKQGRFVIRSCFGGRGDAFVLSGSEGEPGCLG
nr:hypothetical protein HK105_003062 [Polyrhizophydium stewartii]